MPRTWAGAIGMLVALIAFNVWRRYGSDGLRSWVKSIFLNKPDPRPGAQHPGGTKGLTKPAKKVVRDSPVDPWAQAAVRANG